MLRAALRNIVFTIYLQLPLSANPSLAANTRGELGGRQGLSEAPYQPPTATHPHTSLWGLHIPAQFMLYTLANLRPISPHHLQYLLTY